MFNGYSWQTRILEVRPDRLPPEYDINYPLPVTYASPGVYPMMPSQMTYPSSSFSMATIMDELVATSLASSGSASNLIQANLIPGLGPSLLDPARSASRAGLHTPSTTGAGRNLYVGNVSHLKPFWPVHPTDSSPKSCRSSASGKT